VRPILVVVVLPSLHLLFGIRQIIEPVYVETFIPQAAVERLDKCVIGRFARPRELQDDLVGVRPKIDQPAGELAAVVAVNTPWRTACRSDATQHGNDIHAAEALARLDCQALPASTEPALT